jgi:hypothetical protein
MHIHGIYHVYVDVLHIHGIYMVYPWIYMVYHLMHIHGIYVVYHGIFLAFWNQISLPPRAAGLIQCAHACGWSRVFYFTCHQHGNCARKKAAHKRLNPTAANVPRLSLVTAVTAAAAGVSLAAFHFPSLLAGNNLNLGVGWGRGCLQDRWPMCWRALNVMLNRRNIMDWLISYCKDKYHS